MTAFSAPSSGTGLPPVLLPLLLLSLTASPALAQEGSVEVGLWPLFRQSFDVFTIVLVLGSFVAVAAIVRVMLEVTRANIAPVKPIQAHDAAIRNGRPLDTADDSFVSRVLAAAIQEKANGPVAMRESAEIAASSETASWFRRIELLALLGNLGPLVGLAGTVWGMILAFTSLGATQGQAGPGDLSLGISKALFHTLLGLLLAIPCLLVHGVYRARIDKLCNEALAQSARLTEALIAREHPAAVRTKPEQAA